VSAETQELTPVDPHLPFRPGVDTGLTFKIILGQRYDDILDQVLEAVAHRVNTELAEEIRSGELSHVVPFYRQRHAYTWRRITIGGRRYNVPVDDPSHIGGTLRRSAVCNMLVSGGGRHSIFVHWEGALSRKGVPYARYISATSPNVNPAVQNVSTPGTSLNWVRLLGPRIGNYITYLIEEVLRAMGRVIDPSQIQTIWGGPGVTPEPWMPIGP
jgi:hypothetical protein